MHILVDHGVGVCLTEDDCDLLDSIYLPSKYPLAGALPFFEPDDALCMRCLSLAQAVLEQVRDELGK